MKKRRTWPLLLAVTLGVAGSLAAALLTIDGLRIESPRISRLPGAANLALSVRECDALCKESFIPLQGVTRQTTLSDLQAMLVKTYGEFSGKELFDAYRDNRMIVAQGKLFFPTAELCRQQSLRGECAELCPEAMRTP